MSETQRSLFLDRFQQENETTLVGFVVLGGVFGEGIDLVGDRLTGAAIVGVGLPGLSLERELIKRYFSEVEENGFLYAYVYPGMIRVLQAAGRVIRSETDRGAVLFIDPRYARWDTQSLFPEDWSLHIVENETQLESKLNDFWRHG